MRALERQTSCIDKSQPALPLQIYYLHISRGVPPKRRQRRRQKQEINFEKRKEKKRNKRKEMERERARWLVKCKKWRRNNGRDRRCQMSSTPYISTSPGRGISRPPRTGGGEPESLQRLFASCPVPFPSILFGITFTRQGTALPPR